MLKFKNLSLPSKEGFLFGDQTSHYAYHIDWFKIIVCQKKFIYQLFHRCINQKI